MGKYHELDVVVEAVLSGEGLKVLQSLTAEEQAIAWQLLQEIKKNGTNDWLNQLWALDFETEPPSFQEFLDNPEYMHHVGIGLYPKWRDALMECMDPTNYKNEIVMRGSIGSGKTYVGALICSYDLCLLMHLKSPAKYLKHAESSPIYFALISSDLSQLERNLWNYTLQMMKGSPFFTKHSSLKAEKEYKSLSVKFPKNIELMGGSLPPHVLGTNLYFACMDETNYRRSAKPQEESFNFYLAVRNRVENRFIEQTGKGRIVLISSEGDEGSFLDTHCERLRKKAINDYYIMQYSEWEIKGHTMKLSGEKFKVDIGDQLRSPIILREGDVPRQGARIIEAPIEYMKSAERDIISFLKDRAGVVPGRANKYFYNVEALSEAFQLPNPVLSEVCELALDTPYEAHDYLDESALVHRVLGKWVPKVNPERPRFIHIDLSKSQDLTGVSMSHVGDYAAGGSPILFQDFCIGFSASKHKPIDFDKILELVKWLTSHGFNIKLVTYDTYQSAHSINILEKLGYNVKVRSVDILKNTPSGRIQPEYNEFRSMIALGRVRLVQCSRLRREAIELQNVNDKPDHDDTGSKDMIDATVGSAANAVDSVRDSDFGTLSAPEPLRTAVPVSKYEPISREQLIGDIDRSPDGEFIEP